MKGSAKSIADAQKLFAITEANAVRGGSLETSPRSAMRYLNVTFLPIEFPGVLPKGHGIRSRRVIKLDPLIQQQRGLA